MSSSWGGEVRITPDPSELPVRPSERFGLQPLIWARPDGTDGIWTSGKFTIERRVPGSSRPMDYVLSAPGFARLAFDTLEQATAAANRIAAENAPIHNLDREILDRRPGAAR